MDVSRNEEQARLDDAACAERGYAWPGDAYTECRRQLADARQREQWQELQLSRQQQRPEIGIQAESPIEPYRPIPERDFHCRRATDSAGDNYIACGEERRD